MGFPQYDIKLQLVLKFQFWIPEECKVTFLLTFLPRSIVTWSASTCYDQINLFENF